MVQHEIAGKSLGVSLKILVSLARSAWQLAGFSAPLLLLRYLKLSLFLKSSPGKFICSTKPENHQHGDNVSRSKTRSGDLIIPIFNNFTDLENLLHHIDHDEFPADKVILINDASIDERIAPLLHEFSQAATNRMVITNPHNLGFIGSVNRGIEASQNDVVILNTDIILPKSGLSRLFSRLWQEPKIATVTPFTNSGFPVGFPKTLENNLLPWNATAEDVDLCFQKFTSLACLDIPNGVGFCMAISRASLEAIAGFDMAYSPGYGEETDFCLRAAKAGFRNLAAPDIFVYHKSSGSFDSDKTQNLKRKNSLRILQAHPEYQSLIERYFTAGDMERVIFMALLCLCEHQSGARPKICTGSECASINTGITPIIAIDETSSPFKATLIFGAEKYQKSFRNMDHLLEIMNVIGDLENS